MRDAQPDDLLNWYDRHARDLPWRVQPEEAKAGRRPDPYRVWLSEIMLQQTTVAAVKAYFERFTTLWPDVHALADAEDADVMAEWAGLGYYARARNLLKCARIIARDHGGVFPDVREDLQALPGIGPYTSAAISAIAFDRRETVVDGNVERVMARLHDCAVPLPQAKPVLTRYAERLSPEKRPGDYAQAVMDLGATICTPRNPACGICPWRAPCAARRAGTAAELPRKTPKKKKPVRRGIIYVAQRDDGAWLLERRPDSGLLGGMLGFPGTIWAESTPQADPPLNSNWTMLEGEVRHTFTHFHLRLDVQATVINDKAEPTRGEFHLADTVRPDALPTVMRKVLHLSETWFRQRLVNEDTNGEPRHDDARD